LGNFGSLPPHELTQSLMAHNSFDSSQEASRGKIGREPKRQLDEAQMGKFTMSNESKFCWKLWPNGV
jgi:hypothetical protein